MAVSVRCEECGKTFLVKPYQAEARRFCSWACKKAHHSVTRVCEQCGKAFKRYKSAEWANLKHCSMKCRRTAEADVRAKVPTKPPRLPVYVVCQTCGEKFRVPPVREATARYCSRPCRDGSPEYRAGQAAAQAGPKSWRWAGGHYKDRDGYVRVREEGNTKTLNTFAHRRAIAQALIAEFPQHPFLVREDGVLRLSPAIDVHHIDRNRSNNELRNLLAVTKEAHARIHTNGTKPQPWECWPSDPTEW